MIEADSVHSDTTTTNIADEWIPPKNAWEIMPNPYSIRVYAQLSSAANGKYEPYTIGRNAVRCTYFVVHIEPVWFNTQGKAVFCSNKLVVALCCHIYLFLFPCACCYYFTFADAANSHRIFLVSIVLCWALTVLFQGFTKFR